MVDIMDMEDIFYDILTEFEWVEDIDPINARIMAKKLIKEVADFVSSQQHIKCVNCKGYKFKNLKSWNR